MSLSSWFLKKIISMYRSEWDNGHPLVHVEGNLERHQYEYGILQFKTKIKTGIGDDIYMKNVLEIGCGQGGICIYAAMVGAQKVTGIDVSDSALFAAKNLKGKIEHETGKTLPLEYKKMFAENLEFKDQEIDIIIADNVFEHVGNLNKVMSECARVLNKHGKVIVPNFPSFRSKYGPHVKYGIKLPWVHIFFSEKTIVKVMHQLALTDPKMYEFYPGLKNGAKTFKEIRAYKDLNYISNKIFIQAAKKSGLHVESMYVTRSKWHWLLMKAFPILRKTVLEDILSLGTSAVLVKKI